MAQTVFDNSTYDKFNLKRETWLKDILNAMLEGESLATAIDVGCGVGYFSGFLHRLGFTVTAIDGRSGNIEEAQRRYPEVYFKTTNVEAPEAVDLGRFDMVLCLGLLYHLENPFRAIRNLSAITEKHLIIDSFVVPTELPGALLQEELRVEDQGLDYVAFIPSEACLVMMLYKSGFHSVYAVKQLPDHHYYKKTFYRSRMRTLLIATKTSLDIPQLTYMPKVHQRRDWSRPWWYLKLDMLKRLLWQVVLRKG